MKRFFHPLNKWLIPALLLASALLMLNPMGIYLFDIMQSLAVYGLAGYYMLCAWFLFRKQWIAGFSSLASFLILLGFLLPYLSPEREKLGQDTQLTVAHFNVFKYNTDYDGMVWTAHQTEADLLSFQEVDNAWAGELEAAFAEEYPYYEIMPTERCCYGLAVFSKHPINCLDTLWLGDVPSFSGKIQVRDTSIQFVTAHTSAPTMSRRYNKRREHLQALTRHMETLDGPTLLIGDLNAVPWNSDIRTLRTQGGLHDSRTDISPTFPSWMPFVRVPIDYILHSDDLACVNFSTIKSTRSDHFGIVGEYEL